MRTKHEIVRLERYRFNEVTFDRLSDVLQYVEDKIGGIIDSTPNRISRKDALALLDALIARRDELVVLLSATIEVETEGPFPETKSIFEVLGPRKRK
jgi:hypothetical protein